jgi:membrane fusion protein, multidrug efflux system
MRTDHDTTRAPIPGDGQHDVLRPGLEMDSPAAAGRITRRRPFIVAAALVLVLLSGWLVYHHSHKGTGATKVAGTDRGQNLPVPVVEGIVGTKDVPIYLDGLGTVQAFNTVTVRARVDGQLVKVLFTEGQDVKTGDELAQIDPAPYQAVFDQATAKRAQDEAQLANARIDLVRYADLLKTDSITQQIYDTQKALIAQLEATVKADQAAIDSARVNLDYTTIRSPIDGRIGIRQVDQGNIVHASDANGIVVLTQLHPISVVFTLPEQAMTKLHPQTDSPSIVLAVARDNTNLLATGTLAVIDNQIDTTTGTIKLKATFANDNLRLWPGQFVNTRLLLTTRSNSVVVPASVVQRGPEGPFAFVINDDQTVTMRSLKVAQIESGKALIDDGLTPGEHVVVDGQYKLQPGSHVKAAESAAIDGATHSASNAPARHIKKS